MNAASISWGDDPYIQLTVRNAEELASALDRATTERNVDGLPFLIDVSDQDVSANGTSAPVGLQIGIGTDRAKVFWMGADSGVGYQPGVPPEKGELPEFDYGGVPSEETPDTVRVTPAVARQAAQEFLATGARPTCLEWRE